MYATIRAMRGVLVGALLGVVLAGAGWGYASNGRAALPAAGAVGATGGDGPTITIVSALHGARAAAKRFKGIPQRGLVLGRSKAPVMLIEYVDLQCPICKEFD